MLIIAQSVKLNLLQKERSNSLCTARRNFSFQLTARHQSAIVISTFYYIHIEVVMKRVISTASAIFAVLIISISATSQQTIAIEGLYATSTAMGYQTYGPHRLFDGSKETFWMAMPGAAIDEGIMIYFENPITVGSVSAEASASPLVSAPGSLRFYADGADMGSFSTSERAQINKKIKSLFIRIEHAAGMSEKNTKSDMAGFDKKVIRYAGKPAGLAEIIFYDANGAVIKLTPPRLVEGSVKPSSTLQPEEAYHAGYLFDSRKDSGWVEGAKGSGTGESLAFSFSSPVNISKIKIWNGLLISDVHYTANERVKTFSFSSSGESGKDYTITDSQSPQTVQLDKTLTGKDFRFEIKNVYAGKSYKDTVISDIKFGDASGWFTLYTDDIESKKTATLAKIKGSVLEKAVDHYIGEVLEKDMSRKFKSLLIRSDFSFVIWIEDEDAVDRKTIRKTRVLDGFWNIVSLSADKAEINIMGRNYNLAEQFAAYSGNSKVSAVSIFQDKLTITKDGIKGAKFFGSIGL
jgi:hypothetical protein